MSIAEREELYEKIAEWIEETGTTKTSNGSYYIYFTDIAEAFKVSVEWVKEHTEDIKDYLYYLDSVAECDIDDESFGMHFYLHYVCEKCPTYQIGHKCHEECEDCDCWCEPRDEDYKPKVIEYKPYVKSPEQIEAEQKAAQWLKDRQKELSTLKFRCFECDLWREEKELLREAGYFVYDLRDWDEGDGYNIEISVVVNHIGCWVTDIDLKPYMNDGSWIGIDELKLAQIEEIPYSELEELLKKGRELHFSD